MGVRKYAKLTPYLKVVGTVNKTKITVKRQCSDHPKIKQDNAKFCSQCGKEISNIDVPITEKWDAMRILGEHEEFEDSFYSPEYSDVILPNKSMPQNIDIFDDSNQDQSFDVNLLGGLQMIDKQVEWFKTTHAKQIEVLEKAFSKENVNVCWGLVSFWS